MRAFLEVTYHILNPSKATAKETLQTIKPNLATPFRMLPGN